MSEPNNTCDFCDEIAIPSDFIPRFQLVANQILHDELIVNGDLAMNPFSEITSANFTFKLTYPFVGTSPFYLNIEDQLYIFTLTLSTTPYVETISGNVHYVVIGVDFTGSSQANYEAHVLAYFNEQIDVDFSSTTSLLAHVFTVTSIPSGSYMNNPYGMTNTEATITPPTMTTTNLYYVDEKLCYEKHDATYGNLNGVFSIEFNQALDNGAKYQLKFGYKSANLSYNIEITVDDGTNPPQVFTPTLDNTFGTIEVEFYAMLTTSHTITIEITDIYDSSYAFCLDDFSLIQYEFETLSQVLVTNCDNVTSEIEFETTGDSGNVLVLIAEDLPSVFQLTFIDSESLTFYSRWYVIKDQDECIGDIKIRWLNECKLGELDYLNLPFDNQLYLTGVKIKLPLELHDSADSITPDGRKISIYKNTQAVYELRLHPYLEQTQDNLERIFEHSEVYINDEKYNAVDIYKTSEIDNGIYTGLVDILKEDTQLITSACCC